MIMGIILGLEQIIIMVSGILVIMELNQSKQFMEYTMKDLEEDIDKVIKIVLILIH